MSFLSGSLFDEILVNPVREGADKLLVVSGYASANMVARHSDSIKKEFRRNLNIELIVGMCPQDGLDVQNHKSFVSLESSLHVSFKCLYIINRPSVHAKVYTWMKNGRPFLCFAGSVNYTQNGFSNSVREVVASADPQSGYEYYNSLIPDTVRCTGDPGIISGGIDLYTTKRIVKEHAENNELDHPSESRIALLGQQKVKLSFLDSSGHVPSRSGLNWGQRPEYRRDPDQAYINIPVDIGRSGFFPEKGKVFTIATDDDNQLICVRAQDGGKGLHTTFNNAILGKYFRARLGLRNGVPVTVNDLLRYGRTDVTIYKINDESYYLDFSL